MFLFLCVLCTPRWICWERKSKECCCELVQVSRNQSTCNYWDKHNFCNRFITLEKEITLPRGDMTLRLCVLLHVSCDDSIHFIPVSLMTPSNMTDGLLRGLSLLSPSISELIAAMVLPPTSPTHSNYSVLSPQGSPSSSQVEWCMCSKTLIMDSFSGCGLSSAS